MSKSNPPSKKVILFLVEGITDKTSLALILSKTISSGSIFVAITHGDICYKESVTITNAKEEVNRYIMDYMGANKFKKSDMLQVIHLIDTDGAFIPEDKVIDNPNVKTLYLADRIETAFPFETKERIKNKTQIISSLSATSSISNIPYSIYYFSRNLEHVLHNIAEELDNAAKGLLSDEFEEKFADEPFAFIDFIQSKDFAVEGTYSESWHFIRHDINSLKRYCNFGLFFSDNQSTATP